MNLHKIGLGGVDWMDLAQNVVGSCEHRNECLEFGIQSGVLLRVVFFLTFLTLLLVYDTG
jgi:uncharacterized membrane protein YkvI